MIILWGIADERPLAAVRAALAELGRPCFVFDQREAPQLSLEVRFAAAPAGRLVARTEAIDLECVTAVYVRPYDPTAVPAVARGSDGHARRHALALHQTFRAWTDVTEARVINRVGAMGSNGSKPYQSLLVRRSDFQVPETLVTTDPEAAWAFLERHQRVVYKSISDVRSVVAEIGPEQRTRLADIAGCPTQFQARVPGIDVRVHVVGERLFALQVESEAVDYRYPGEHAVQRTRIELPGDVADRCRELARALELPLAGIDLRRTAGGEWFCFEVNPMPAFSYFDLDGEVARAVAGLLAQGGAS